jgi:UDP-glucose 4-epimerase
MNFLITGGCGFIGTNLVKNLIEEGGHFVRIIDNLSAGTRADLARVCTFTEITPNTLKAEAQVISSGVELIVGDILDADLALHAAHGMDVIVHLAANAGVEQSVKDPHNDCLTNVIGTFNYLEAARKKQIKRFIFSSSGAPVGECEPPIHEELVPHPVSPYGASKLAGEAYCSAYFRTFGLDTVALRFGNVYGPGSSNKNSVVAKFIKQALNGETLEIYGDGNQTRDFIYIDDLIRAIRLSTSVDNIGGETFQIAANVETTVESVAKKLLLILADAGCKNVPIVHSTPRLGDVRRNYSDVSKARKLLSWQTSIDLSEGLKRTFEWFMNDSSFNREASGRL